MLYVFVRDMWDVLRLRYRSPETYLYSPLVMAAVLLLLGVVNAASMSPLFGSGAAAVCLSVIFGDCEMVGVEPLDAQGAALLRCAPAAFVGLYFGV